VLRVEHRDLPTLPTASSHTLILHGTRDNSAPIRLSQALRDRRPDLVTLETFDADHTLAWNSDPERWRSAVTAWLRGRPSP